MTIPDCKSILMLVLYDITCTTTDIKGQNHHTKSQVKYKCKMTQMYNVLLSTEKSTVIKIPFFVRFLKIFHQAKKFQKQEMPEILSICVLLFCYKK